MEVSLLLSLPEGLRVERLEPQGELLAITVVSVRASSCCPLCAQASSRIHSHYQRTLRDVPCGGRKVVLHLSVRRFFCRNPACTRKIFTERLPAFIEPWARVTIRLFEEVQAIGLATSGELGTRLADRIGIHASPTTILRRIMALPSLPSPQVAYLGIDDWSFRRGRKFGTILVDLTSHKILDLLPDRDAQTAAAWMKKHPEIELVSRDRGEEYAAAARLGAPQAIQCADRFHLAQNLTEIVEVILASCRAEIRQTVKTQLPPREVLTWLGMLNGRIAITNCLNCAKPGSPSRRAHAVSAWENGRCATGLPVVSPMGNLNFATNATAVVLISTLIT